MVLYLFIEKYVSFFFKEVIFKSMYGKFSEFNIILGCLC